MTLFRFAIVGLAALVTVPAAVAQDGAAPGRITVAQAIAAARAHGEGGILEADLERRRSGHVWEIDIAGNDTVTEVIVDAATGEVLSSRQKRIEGAWRGWFDNERLAVARSADAELGTWLDAAESELGGRVSEVSLDEEDGRLAYELEVDTANGEIDAYIDAATGQIVRGKFDD